MVQTIFVSIGTVSGLGALLALVLYVVSSKFKVEEDPLIDEVEDVLPGANCGGCGFAGCRNFAEALVRDKDLDKLHCPPGGNDTMGEVADLLGVAAVEKDPFVAVVRCSGSVEHRNKTNVYDGVSSCDIAAQLYSGDTGCAHGCLGLGECVDACDFEAMYMDEKTGLPVVIEDKCTSCGACVSACPKDIIELRPVGRRSRRIFVGCMNEEKGGVAKKNCSVACTACSKCVDECKYDAISVDNNLAYVDADLCKLCRKCVDVCSPGAMMEINFPPKKEKKERPARKDRANKDTEAKAKTDDVAVAEPPKPKEKDGEEGKA